MILNLNSMVKLSLKISFYFFMTIICVISALLMQVDYYAFANSFISLASAAYCIVIPIKMMLKVNREQ